LGSSSAFDIATFAILRLGFDAGAALFRSGWFIESTLTELAAMLVLRTTRPFFEVGPSRSALVEHCCCSRDDRASVQPAG
jgi:Mg2+-importing ATPase